MIIAIILALAGLGIGYGGSTYTNKKKLGSAEETAKKELEKARKEASKVVENAKNEALEIADDARRDEQKRRNEFQTRLPLSPWRLYRP